ncbi:MAG: N-acetyl-gamma-glutamyl-phosphate reductase [Hydrocarboniphaga sp.]|uniref:N-acetyl-gamma-glutamyl-phosphate reductase n=1 Tax=Hydrocarboniphaga sp. TaxID=2033016 RepID=UPI0026285623|nr:N-acetyl-gamma-glutamyl-phosphate reductase [Hydrocarboniphaga sp.]MDB5972934.1 N-acetyl-gamma-glutamyl-phosphate reductase [Hydrocarboniphaga sp.]
MIKVGIVGGTGYTGAELLRLFAAHPQVRVTTLTSRKEAGLRADQLFPSLRGHSDAVFSAPDEAALAACDAVFFATPHGTAMQMAPALVEQGVKVIDLSADFRIKDAAEFKRWYQLDHTAPALLKEAVYGLPEVNRHAIRSARVIGNPGCYPTAVQLGFLPLLEAGVIDATNLIADCKSGVSGAGREARVTSLFGETSDNFRAYSVPGHRHLPEIEQGLRQASETPVSLTFVPHLTPMIRGIHATLYARLTRPALDLQALFESRYRGEPFVDVMPAGEHPETRSVRGGNQCRIAVHLAPDGRTVVVLSVIDNLVKGAAGQAVQCFNLMFDQPESTGLDAPGLTP